MKLLSLFYAAPHKSCTGLSARLLALFIAPSIFCSAQPRHTPLRLQVPDRLYPGSPTHIQVRLRRTFTACSNNFNSPIGVFDGQSDNGGAACPWQRLLRCDYRPVHNQLCRLQHLVSRAMNSATCGRRCPAMSPLPPMYLSPTPRVGDEKSCSSFARTSMTAQRKPWSANMARE